jgi:hypothetical protein
MKLKKIKIKIRTLSVPLGCFGVYKLVVYKHEIRTLSVPLG